MKTLLKLLFVFCAFQGMAQSSSPVYLETSQENGFFMIWSHNDSPREVEVKLVLKEVTGLRGNLHPVEKTIPPKEKAMLVRLKTTGEPISLAYDFDKRYPTILESKKVTLKDAPNLDEGILVFDKEGCPRCDYTTNYLIEHEIDFKLLDIQKRENNLLLQKMLSEENIAMSQLRTPIVFVDGKFVKTRGDIKKAVKSLWGMKTDK